MPSYRLLRSNKESGPYSLNDLVKLGLKPYDLVWVDGRSAAWRYASEISELKEFAPAVEEQPYDRFFKRPSEGELRVKQENDLSNSEIPPSQKAIDENFAKAEPVQKTPVLAELPVTNKTTPTVQSASQSYQPQPIKKIFVSMPEMDGFNPYADSPQAEKYAQYLPKPTQIQQDPLPNKDEKAYSAINIRESDESRLETKYTQSLDDIKEMYINTLVQRKTKNKRKEIIKRYVKPALLPLLLVVLGIAIGYFITNRKKSLHASQSVSNVLPQTPPEKKAVTPEQNSEDPLDQNIPQASEEKPNGVAVTDNKNDKPIIPAEEKSSILPERNGEKRLPQRSGSDNNSTSFLKTVDPIKQKETVKQGESSVPSNEISSGRTVQKRNVRVDPNTGERQSVVRDNNDLADGENDNKSNPERSIKKKDSEHSFLQDERKDIHDMVAIKNNNYVRGTFGGIRGLELTLYNNSNYLLDEVSVELQIIKPSEQPLRTDIITFKNISANATVTVKVPDSQRGIRVEYRITNIESKQWEKGTAGL